MSKTVLIVDDDSHIREVIRYALEKDGKTVIEADNGKVALGKFQERTPDLVILDIMMPEMDGLETCRQLRKDSDVPILFLSSKDDEVDRIVGLELGGDDYVTKPFSPRELVARVNVIFKWLARESRSASKNTNTSEPMVLCDLKLNPESYEVFWQSNPVILTATEFNLLQTLMRYPKKVYTRDDLLQADIFKDIITDRTIDSHIRRLRGKFDGASGNTIIETIRGIGYKMGPCQL